MIADRPSAEDLSHTMAELSPDQAVHAMPEVLRQIGGHLLDHMAEDTPMRLSPMPGVLTTARATIERVENSSTRTDLAKLAIETIIDSLPASYTSKHAISMIVPLADEASNFAGLLARPDQQASALLNISATTAREARNIQNNPGNVSLALSVLGGKSAEHIAQLAGGLSRSDVGHELSLQMYRQCRSLYKEAIHEAKQITDPKERLKRQSRIAVALAMSAAQLQETSQTLPKSY